MKSILIARVSTEEQKETGNSLPAQIARLEKYCQNKGFTILRICSFDESAYTDQRNEFDNIVDFILEQKEKVVVCCDKVDRISRNVFDKRISLLYERALSDEIELHFVSDGQIINSRISAVEKFQFSISLGLAKYYSDAISDNVKRAMEQKLRKGEWPAKAPYGYKNIRRENGFADIVIDEYGSHVIRTVFELYATGAYSIDLLCKKIKTDFGIKWPKGSLAAILDNTFYHGEMRIKGKAYPHRYSPLISRELFDQVQKVKNSFNKKPFKYAGLPYIYRGLIRCGDCGLSITPEKHKGLVYYHCTQYNGKHGAKWLREEYITEQLSNVFKRLQMPQTIVQKITDSLSVVHKDKIDFHTKQFDKLTSEQKNLTTMLDNLYLDKLKGKISDEQYDRFYASLREQATDISIRIERLQNAEDNYYITAKYILDVINQAHELFMSSEVEGKRHLIKLVLQNLRVEGENLLWEAHKPFDLILDSVDSQLWSPLVDAFRNGKVEFTISLSHIQSTFSFLNASLQ
jgi:site-specific DNA recombinase